MTTVFSNAAIETFNACERACEFVMQGRDVRPATPDDSPNARIRVLVDHVRTSGVRVVTVKDSLGRQLHRGVIDEDE